MRRALEVSKDFRFGLPFTALQCVAVATVLFVGCDPFRGEREALEAQLRRMRGTIGVLQQNLSESHKALEDMKQKANETKEEFQRRLDEAVEEKDRLADSLKKEKDALEDLLSAP
jgi:hypothetical protein